MVNPVEYGSFAGKTMKFFIFHTNESIQDYIQLNFQESIVIPQGCQYLYKTIS